MKWLSINVRQEAPISRPAKEVIDFLWSLENLLKYEPKVDSVWVHPRSEQDGTYFVQGRFAGVRWNGAFS
jgi:hypothetical protein